jgi:hypothetical protein
VILAVVQLTNSIANMNRAFNPLADNLLANFFTQHRLAQAWHDGLIDNGSIADGITQNWPIIGQAVQSGAIAIKRAIG